MGLNIFQVSVIMFYVAMGKVKAEQLPLSPVICTHIRRWAWGWTR